MATSNPESFINEIKRLTESTSGDTDSDYSSKSSKTSNRNSLRINRSKRLKGLINHEYCDACDEGGNLLNCDRCPASFHFVCFEPPLNEDDPDLLKNEFLCNQCKSNSLFEPKLPTITNLSRTRNGSKNDLIQQSQKEASNSNSSASSTNNQTTNKQQQYINFEIIDNEPALKTLIRLAKIMNPRQMKLPKNIQNTFEIPGLSKVEWWTKEGTKLLDHKENIKKKEVKDNFISIPRKTCFVCRKTSRIGQLIKCDFCPLNYHLNCLNPPLCSVPKDRWMCPNHVEHFIDQKLLNSSNRLSDRIKLWHKYSNIDAHDVKFQFIKKIQNYKNNKKLLRHIHENPKQFQQEQQQQLHKCDGKNSLCSKIPDAIKQFYSNPIKVKDVYKSINEITSNHDSMSEMSMSENESKDLDMNTESDDNKISSEPEIHSVRANEIEKEIWLSAVSCLANLKTSQQDEHLPEIPAPTSPITTSESSSQSIDDDKLSPNLNTFPIIPTTKYCKEAIKPRALLCLINNKSFMNKNLPDYSPTHMIYRTFTIGTNENSDLCLNKYEIKCEYASAKHACIFYDEYSNHYELLNYSENGTVVDNILFSNNLDTKAADNDSADDEDFLSGKSKMSSKATKNYWSCKCESSLSDLFDGKCWEGPAILNHGSHIKIGCLEFVFCIVDYSNFIS